jgi:hypothetical protein
MAGAQRAVTGRRPAEPDPAPAWLPTSLVALLCNLSAFMPQAWGEPDARAQTKQELVPARKKAPPAVGQLPDSRHKTQSSEQGKAPKRRGRRGEPKSERTINPQDRGLVPMVPAPFVPKLAPTLAAPPERLVVPVRPAAPMEPAVPQAQQVESPDKRVLQVQPVMSLANPAAHELEQAALEEKPEAHTPPQASAGPPENPVLPPAEAPLPPAEEADQSPAMRPRALSRPATAASAIDSNPPPAAKPEPSVLDQAVFDQIRLEIKSRLPYFQACADAARRRGSPDIRRVQATWHVAADGVIKELRLEGIPDPRLATCITRMGSRPFEVKPGVELTIPTPIVFVR